MMQIAICNLSRISSFSASGLSFQSRVLICIWNHIAHGNAMIRVARSKGASHAASGHALSSGGGNPDEDDKTFFEGGVPKTLCCFLRGKMLKFK